MKNYFLIFLVTLLALSFSAPVLADEAWLGYDPFRSGEGITVTASDNTLVFLFYTYTEEVTEIPPEVSPSIPDPEPFAANEPVWYIGSATDYDGDSASGSIYATTAVDYPNSVNGSVSDSEVIGQFLLVRKGNGPDATGWNLIIVWEENLLVPWHLNMYHTVYTFSQKLIAVSN